MSINNESKIFFPEYLDPTSLQHYVESIVELYAIPALSIAIWHNNTLHQAAAGILNVETKVEATPDALFQVGSIAKLITATLMMQLVDRGSVELDTPVKKYLRDFQVADPNATKQVTVRQLLNHTSGLAGDFFVDDPITGGNPIARYVDRCCLLPQAHPIGKYHSYSNAAYAIAGRLIEVMMGVSWFDAVEEQIIKPLGLSHTFVNPIHAPRFRTAMGHLSDSKNLGHSKKSAWQIAPSCYLPLGQAPAGSTLSMSAEDLITFARAHLNQGLIDGLPNICNRSDKHWLSAKAVQQMQTSNVELPPHSPMFMTDVGLGWFMTNNQYTPVIGHDGATLGQASILRLVPEQQFAFAIQTNCLKAAPGKAVFDDLLATLTDIQFTQAEPIGIVLDPNTIIGTYDSFDGTITISLTDGGELVATRKDKVLLSSSQKWVLRAIDTKTVALYSEQGERKDGTMGFLEQDSRGVPAYLYFGFRLHRRI